MTWLEVCNDKNLRNLPYKIELNQAGQQGALTFFDPSGKIPHSRLCPQFPHRLASS